MITDRARRKGLPGRCALVAAKNADRAAFDLVFARDGVRPEKAAMFEDDPRNLAVPHALGMRTVHVAPEGEPAHHIEYHTDDLSGFLARPRD